MGNQAPGQITQLLNAAGEGDGLAELYGRQGRHDEAEALFRRVLDTRTRVLGEEHPDTLASMRKLPDLYDAWGEPQKAAEWRTGLDGAQAPPAPEN